MLGLDLAQRPSGVIAIGAHPDDIEIGCGGTLLRLARRWPGLPVTVVILTGSPERIEEARTACELFLPGCEVTLQTFALPDGLLPTVWGEVKANLEDIARSATADLVLAPRLGDAHQDHRLLAQLVPTVWRNHIVAHYEIPKWDGDVGRPNVYVPMDEETAREKADLLSKAYPSQVGRHWWDERTFLGLARIRGIECRAEYAEGFEITKAVLAW